MEKVFRILAKLGFFSKAQKTEENIQTRARNKDFQLARSLRNVKIVADKGLEDITHYKGVALDQKQITSDYLIIGSGIMGLALAQEIRNSEPLATISVIEKEKSPAFHASGRNSGVLHAGFYYTGDSLKARFTRDGNRLWRKYCEEKSRIPAERSLSPETKMRRPGFSSSKNGATETGSMSPSSMRKNSPILNPMPEHLISPSGLRIRPRSIPF